MISCEHLPKSFAKAAEPSLKRHSPGVLSQQPKQPTQWRTPASLLYILCSPSTENDGFSRSVRISLKLLRFKNFSCILFFKQQTDSIIITLKMQKRRTGAKPEATQKGTKDSDAFSAFPFWVKIAQIQKNSWNLKLNFTQRKLRTNKAKTDSAPHFQHDFSKKSQKNPHFRMIQKNSAWKKLARKMQCILVKVAINLRERKLKQLSARSFPKFLKSRGYLWTN